VAQEAVGAAEGVEIVRLAAFSRALKKTVGISPATWRGSAAATGVVARPHRL
jgi:hypothetical protein